MYGPFIYMIIGASGAKLVLQLKEINAEHATLASPVHIAIFKVKTLLDCREAYSDLLFYLSEGKWRNVILNKRHNLSTAPRTTKSEPSLTLDLMRPGS